MTDKKNTKTIAPIDIDALVEQRLNVNKEELRNQILEEQLSELLQSEAIQEANLHDFLEQLKGAGKEIWKLVSSKPISEVARSISGAARLEKRLKSKKTRRANLTKEQLADAKGKVLELLKASKEGQTAGQIAKALSLDLNLQKRALSELRQSKQIAITGEKRSTRYLVA